MNKPDEGHILTENELKKLERKIAKVYREAAKELDDTITDYFDKFKKRDAEMQKLIGTEQNGRTWTEQDYKQWRLNQIGRGKRYEALRDKLAERMTRANEVAISYVNDKTPTIYSINRNYAAYTVEQINMGADFTLFNERVVKRLLIEQPDLMPSYPRSKAVKRGIDLDYGKKQIGASILSGILQGKSIGDIAADLQRRIITMSLPSAIRTARTAVTEAQNAGRQDTYIAANDMGIKVRKRWLATLDGRTRHDHGMLDGQTVETDKPFEYGGYRLMFPADGSLGAPAYTLYNCRCTMVTVDELDDMLDQGMRRAIDPETGRSVLVPWMTYQEWAKGKETENPDAWETFIKKQKNLSADKKQYDEYRKLLGKNVPSTLDAFQNLKYNDSDKWDYTKRFAQYMRKYPTSDKRYFDLNEHLKKAGIDKGIALPPEQKTAYILPEGKKDPYHIMHRMIERGMTDDSIRGYMKNADVMFVQWGGHRQLFVGKDGCCVITKNGDEWLFKTAWDRTFNDEEMERIIEEIKNVRL